jgi:glycosyltransferase involved in cell wall biosynthesis
LEMNDPKIRTGIYTPVAPSPHTGVGRQLYGLIAGLADIDSHNEYVLYTALDAPISMQAANFQNRPVPVRVSGRAKNHLFQLLQLPRLAADHNLDVLHIPNSMPLLFPYRPTIVTIYDLTEFALPQRVYEKGRHSYRRLANRLAARRADLIITTSANTRQDIVRYLGVDEAKVRVIYPGIDHEQFRPQPISPPQRAHLAQKYQLPERFLLYVGKIQPRKNLPRLLRAFHQVRKTLPDLHLVLAGTGGWMSETLKTTILELELDPFVHFTGFVADEDLPALYNLAEIMVFPSLYEGFGFPVVEAMACGTPVITSTTSSLGEIADTAALCVDPTSIEELTAALQTLLNDRQSHNAFRQKGLIRAQAFTWIQCAEKTLACYHL